ncbi:MAG: hypothetical protein CM15mP9_4030 [Methanobacteriota archaeon]|nr:MAG: hypothetical protein CM15mP9_4030 [Euryarchaeota archaeon]
MQEFIGFLLAEVPAFWDVIVLTFNGFPDKN